MGSWENLGRCPLIPANPRSSLSPAPHGRGVLPTRLTGGTSVPSPVRGGGHAGGPQGRDVVNGTPCPEERSDLPGRQCWPHTWGLQRAPLQQDDTGPQQRHSSGSECAQSDAVSHAGSHTGTNKHQLKRPGLQHSTDTTRFSSPFVSQAPVGREAWHQHQEPAQNRGQESRVGRPRHVLPEGLLGTELSQTGSVRGTCKL